MTTRSTLPTLCLAAAVGATNLGCLGTGPKERAGTLAGGVGGGMVARAAGASPAGIIGGMLLGRLIGGAIGTSLDQRDQQLAIQAAQQSFQGPVGQPNPWRNPDSGNSGEITTVREFQNDLGEVCREYRETVRTADGQQEVVTGIACRGGDGVWRE